LPYNIDGFPLARISEIIIDTGATPNPADYGGLLSYNMKLPVFSMVLATFSMVLGVEPLALLPYFCALMGSLAVLFIYVLARELTGNEIAAFSAGVFAALTGLFVYVTTAAMKQLLAITLLCFILYLYTRRNDWRFRLAMVAALFILPFTHHLTSLIALLVLSGQ
jgi:4-amino-4-deoxy-L-arabinose transferase-like glycosyltransferase